MKKIFVYCFIATFSCAFHNLHGADDQPLALSPGSTPWSDRFTGAVSSLIGWVEKKTGTKSINYCIDKTAQQLLKSCEQRLELSLADSRKASRTKTYQQLMNNPNFQQHLKQLNDRAYFEWEHIKNAIAEDRFQDVAKFWKINRINLSPCLRITVRLYLEQNRAKRKAAENPKDSITRFDLTRIIRQPGYVEASAPSIEQEKADFPTLTKIIRDYASTLAISSPMQAAERRLRKAVDSSFSLTYLTSAAEIEKAQHIYAVYFAYLFHARTMKDPISGLFAKQDFLNVFNQVWDRDTHLRYVLNDQLLRGSLDACSIYKNHKENISPLYATLACDMILSHEQQQYAQDVSPAFKTLFFSQKNPYGKYIFMLLNSLSKKQKIDLFIAKEDIKQLAPVEQSAAIHGAIKADTAQLELLAEIQAGGQTVQLLEALAKAKICNDSSAEASTGTMEMGPLILQMDLPTHVNLPSRENSDNDEDEVD